MYLGGLKATLKKSKYFCLCVYSTVLAEPVSELNPSASSSLPSSPPSSSSAATDLPPPGGDPEDDEGMKHLQQVLENS